MRLLAAVLVLTAAGLAGPGAGKAQTPPYGYWTSAGSAPCPNVEGSPAVAECPSPTVACEGYAVFRGGVLTSMTPKIAPSGGLSGYYCNLTQTVVQWDFAQLTCPNLSIGYTRTFAGCVPEVLLDPRAFEPPCGAERGNGATGGSTFGNPTIVANGARLERVADITIGGEPALTFMRYYYGQAVGAGLMGVGWASDLDRVLGLSASGANPSSVTAQWPTGRRIAFTRTGSSPNYTYVGDDDTEERLTQTATGWELRDREDRVESYDKAGRLVALRWRNGYQQRLVRDEGRVLALVDSFQRTLRFTYQGDLLVSVTDPSGRVYRYEYEAPSTFEPKRLSKVIYPDATPADPNDNPSVRYLYEDTRFAYALTGMVDEKGDRFATWQYDAEMRVVASEHAGGVDRFTAGYDRANRITTVTNPLGKETRHHFALVEGKWKPTRIEGRPSTSCAAADQLSSYDSKGFVASRTDWNGNVTNYVNDSRGLPTSITEAVGTPQARTRTVTWHPTLRLPTQIVAPRLSTSLAYDADGNLLTRTATDTTSHSLPYATNGQQRAWTLTYADAGPGLGTPTAAVTLSMVNPAAESGSLTGWTSELGAFTTATSSPSPAEGARYFTAGSVAESL